jgi:hypothetical protein
MMLMSGDFFATGDPQFSSETESLDISRLSKGEKRALVHSRMSAPPDARSGEK